MRRRLLSPEVVQSSAMDCGPAALKCLCEGFGVPVSYDRLREACQTDVDGTSIDTLEQVAARLGLEAEQVMIPLDHLLLPEAAALPALLVVTSPLGATHFVVVWRRAGPWVQVMDPAVGRRWVPAERLLAETYVHAMPVPAPAWREWAGSPDFLNPLTARMERLGVSREDREGLVAAAGSDPGWRGLAALDAAVRMVSALVRAGGLSAGREAAALVRACCEPGSEGDVPEAYWSLTPLHGLDEEDGRLLLKGAVLVRIRGRRIEEAEEPLPAELRAALAEPTVRPGREMLRRLREDGLLAPAALGAAMVVAAGAMALEALFFRGLLDLAGRLGLVEQRVGAAAVLFLFLGIVLLLELAVVSGVLAQGRRLEVRLRLSFLDKVARLGDRYFRSRLSSDMAERSHSAWRLRLFPEVAANFLRSGFQLVFTAAGIAWLDPGVAPLAALSAVLAFAIPLASQPVLRERDLRLRNHAGALGRFYLDALLGLVPARNHGAALPLRREHEGLLLEWMRAGLRLEKVSVGLDLLQSVAGYGLAVWIVVRHLSGTGDVTQVLLLSYWALQLPILGQQMDVAARQVPLLRNTAARLLEPLGAVEEEGPPPLREAVPKTGVEIQFDDVRVVAGGHVILEGVDLSIPTGSRVAIVGPSGAGKSSLVGLLLGWHVPAEGTVLADGEPLTPERLTTLRQETAWIDPAVQLWNAPLLDNLLYGSTEEDQAGEALQLGELRHLLEDLPRGLQSPLGEGGSLVSGGEGQRVRFARALLRPEARLVVLDEPFRGLDREARRRLLDRARAWWPRATLLCVTHDIGQTRTFDRVVVVEGGRVVETGCPDELAVRPGSRYRSLLDHEASIRERFRADAGWRRLRLAGGRLEEEA